MQHLAETIVNITQDYHSDLEDGFRINTDHVIEWVNQFEEIDREFILSELVHMFNQNIYISREKAKELLINMLEKVSSFYKYSSIDIFLNETAFIHIQPKGKSQDILLSLMNEILENNFGRTLAMCGALGAKNYIYLDDILGTGKTFVNNISEWIDKEKQFDNLKSGKIRFLAYFFCIHTWGANNARISLKMKLAEDLFQNEKKFLIGSTYKIENNVNDYNPKLNLIYPQKTENIDFDVYLNSLTGFARNNRSKAYRPFNLPLEEKFFSSKANRNRLETIFTQKGIDIINSIQDEQKRKNHRPLGKTYPSYHTFGTGTMFFTWRNISNTCPIVLWWDNPAHNWKGLFPLHNRGIH
jgi:hypothetical protein